MIICYAVPDILHVTDVTVVFFFHFELFLALLPPKQPEKSKFLKKEKKHLEISSFYNSVPKIMIKCYTVPEICHVTDVIIFHLGHFFPFTPLSVRKIKIKKKKIIILHMCTKNYHQMMYGS